MLNNAHIINEKTLLNFYNFLVIEYFFYQFLWFSYWIHSWTNFYLAHPHQKNFRSAPKGDSSPGSLMLLYFIWCIIIFLNIISSIKKFSSYFFLSSYYFCRCVILFWTHSTCFLTCIHYSWVLAKFSSGLDKSVSEERVPVLLINKKPSVRTFLIRLILAISDARKIIDFSS